MNTESFNYLELIPKLLAKIEKMEDRQKILLGIINYMIIKSKRRLNIGT